MTNKASKIQWLARTPNLHISDTVMFAYSQKH